MPRTGLGVPVGSALWATALLFASAAARAQDQEVAPSPVLPAQLSLASALEIFRASGLDLRLADLSVESAAGGARAARALLNPSLSASVGRSVDYNPSLCSGCSATTWSAALSDSGAIADVAVGKRGLRIAAAVAALASARANREEARIVLESALKQQFIETALAQRALELVIEVVREANDVLALNRVRFEAGAISGADLARAEVEALERAHELDQARVALAFQTIELARQLGVRAREPQSFTVDSSVLRGVLPAKLAKLDESRLLDLAFAHRPDLLAVRHDVERSRAALALAHRSVFPDLQVQLSGTGEGTGQNALQPPTFAVGLSAALPVFYQQQGEIMQARAAVGKDAIRLARMETQVVADVESSLAALMAARAQVERMQGQLLASARNARDLTRIQYERGAASLLDLLDIERSYVDIRRAYLSSLADFEVAVFTLELAVGKEL